MLEEHFKRKDLHAYLYSNALLHNVKALRSLCRPNVKFCAVIKANAYGHGIREVATVLRDADVDFFGVVSVYEAFYIAQLVKKQKILVFEPLHIDQDNDVLFQCVQLGLHCTIASIEAARHIESVLQNNANKLSVHVNINTGMGRCGIEVPKAEKLVEFIDNSESMKLAGIYTHFATADDTDLSFAKEQLDCFQKTLRDLHNYITDDAIIHAANSPATIMLPGSHFDMVRCGISLYGYSTIEKTLPIELKPALKLEAPIVHISTIEKGQSVSYCRDFYANRKTRIAVLSRGYSDGFWRFFSNKVNLIVNNKPAPVIGKVTMNQTIIDITDIPNVRAGQSVTIIDDNFNSPCGVYTLAEITGTICYEVLASIPAWANITTKKNDQKYVLQDT